jgi:ABC-type thiamin/hydroxymethylpyrimidine transport system permease subunit
MKMRLGIALGVWFVMTIVVALFAPRPVVLIWAAATLPGAAWASALAGGHHGPSERRPA